MKYLLDTNALIFSLCNPSGLSEKAEKLITTERELFVSVVSLWEIAIKQSIGKLAIKADIPKIRRKNSMVKCLINLIVLLDH